MKQCINAGEIEIAGARGGKVDVAHRHERYPNQQIQVVPGGFHECLNGYVVRYFVGAEAPGRGKTQQRQNPGNRVSLSAHVTYTNIQRRRTAS